MRRNRRIILAFANTVGFLLTIVMNYLANTLPLNGVQTGEISDRYSNLFVPAGFTFAVWGIIYLLLAIYIVYQLIEAFRIQEGETSSSFIDTISFWFILASIANVLWLFAWHFEVIWLSLILMLLLFGSLLMIYIKLEIDIVPTSQLDRYLVKLPFSVYLGWISVATIANFSAFIVSLLIDADGNIALDNTLQQAATILVVAVAMGLAAFMLLRRKDYPYAIIIAWGLAGVFFARFFDDTTLDLGVEIATAIGVISILGGVVWHLFFRRS